MVLKWFCLGSNEKAMVLLRFCLGSNETILVLHRFCLGSEAKGVASYVKARNTPGYRKNIGFICNIARDTPGHPGTPQKHEFP